MTAEKALWKASRVFAPDFPRRASDEQSIQRPKRGRTEFVEGLSATRDAEMPGYYSVYSFPRGHPKEEAIPKVDCIFIDLDLAKGEYDPETNPSFEAWERDMSALLARARMIATTLLEENRAENFRVVLSGHKGLHLYLDFPTVAPQNGDYGQFKNGLSNYGEQVMDWLDATAGGINIEPWVDVDASDLARLARHPNTRHHGAAYDDTERWAVPITVEELANLSCDDYLDYTSSPRWPDGYERTPSESAGKKVAQAVRAASSTTALESSGEKSRYDPQAVSDYKERSNDNITLEDVLLLVKNKPCFEAFRNRDDAYDHGQESRVMELSIMGRFIDMGVPIDVMHEFFEVIPRYDEGYTQDLIEDLIGRGYSEFNCAKIVGDPDTAGEAERFCLTDDCAVYQRNDDLGA